MEFDKNLAFLTIAEQKRTGLKSPIDIETDDLHGMREAADIERDELEAAASFDYGELSGDDRANLPARLEQARARSELMRQICRTAAMNSLVNGPTQ